MTRMTTEQIKQDISHIELILRGIKQGPLVSRREVAGWEQELGYLKEDERAYQQRHLTPGSIS